MSTPPLKIPAYSQTGEKVKELELNPEIFGVPIKESVVHQVAVAQMANSRQVLAHTKDRGEVRGGGRKPWRQKGTGRARHGSIRSPLWKGGGVTFGPTKERNFSQKVNKKMKRKALFMCLSDRVNDKRLILLDKLEQSEGKTKKMRALLDNLFTKLFPEESIESKQKIEITYFVHGTTFDNEKNMASGWYDVELSQLGKQQNVDLGKIIKERGDKYKVVFCSNLKRAVETAEVAFKDFQIIKDERLRECNYGDLNHHSEGDFNSDNKFYIENKHPNGESYKDVEKRIREFLKDVLKKYKGKRIAIVSHRTPQLALDVILKGKTWEQAIAEDWRERKAWQPGWEYEINKTIIEQLNSKETDATRENETPIKNKQKVDKLSILIILDKSDKNIIRANRNISGIKVDVANNLNVVDVLKHKYLLMVEPALQVLEKTFLKD